MSPVTEFADFQLRRPKVIVTVTELCVKLHMAT